MLCYRTRDLRKRSDELTARIAAKAVHDQRDPSRAGVTPAGKSETPDSDN